MAMVYTTVLLAILLPTNGLQVRRNVVLLASLLAVAEGGGGRKHGAFVLSRRSSSVRYQSLPHPIEPWRRRADATTLHLLKGLVPTVDDDINRETEDANLSSFELFQRELEEGASIPAAISAVNSRRKDKAGDYENKYKILSDYRSYSNRELLDTDHFDMAPTLDDLNQQQPDKGKVIWVTSLYRLAVFLGAFFFFPVLCSLLNLLVDVTEDEFDIINDQFTPGIGILYGTFVALTLDILYERQGKVQENASVEASLLSQVTQNVLNLFRDEIVIAREATQTIADQVRIIVYRSRGSELLNIMRADPYARLLSIVDHYQRDKTSFTPHQEALIDGLRSEIPALMEARAKRLSDEASALPPTHFLVLSLLTALSLIGFTAATLTITDADGNPPLESRMVFAGLSAVYVLFFNFCNDMNDPFDGVYQIKRSSAASYLLQIKWLIASQPFGSDIKFDTRGLAPVYDGNEVFEIEKGAQKVEASPSSSEPSQKTAETVTDVRKESVPQQKAATSIEASSSSEPPQKTAGRVTDVKKESVPQQKAATSIETLAPGVSITTESSTGTKVNVAVQKSPSLTAKDLMPQRKKAPSDAATKQSETLNEEMVSQFESLSGFSSDKTENGGGVTVPSKSTQDKPLDKKKISMYFRKTGGFGGEK